MPRSRRRPPARLDQSPIAITTTGKVVAGLGYAAGIDNADDLITVIRQRRWKGGKLFIGVVLDDRRQAETLRRIDDSAAELAAVAGVFVPPASTRKGQR